VRGRHRSLDVEAVGTGHVQVEQDAVGFMVVEGLQERRAGLERLDLEAGG
jgi:hypothetical protein